MRNLKHVLSGFEASALLGLLISGSLAAEPLQDALAQLKSTEVIKRRIGAQELVNLRNPEAAPALLTALNDKDAYVRTLAARALGYMRWTAAGPRLAEVLSSDGNTEVRQTAALSLRFLNDKSALPALFKATKDPAKAVRLTAISSLANFRDPAAVPALTETAKDTDPEIRRTALYALAQIGDAASIPLFKSALKDSDAAVRANAAQAFAKLPPREGTAELKEALKDTDPRVQMSAAWTLAIRGDRSGYDTALAAANVPNRQVQILAIETLGYIKDRSAVPMLESLLQNKDGLVKQAAEQALTRIKEKRK